MFMKPGGCAIRDESLSCGPMEAYVVGVVDIRTMCSGYMDDVPWVYGRCACKVSWLLNVQGDLM